MLSSNGPGVTAAKEKWPSCAVGVAWTGFVVPRVSLTWAPETGAPVTSSTVPLILPSAREFCGCPLAGVVASAALPCDSLAVAAEGVLSVCANRGEEPSKRPQSNPTPGKATRKKGFEFLYHQLGPICPFFSPRKQHLHRTRAIPESVALFARLAQRGFGGVARFY